MLKKKLALVLVMLMVFSTFSISMADTDVELPLKEIDLDGNDNGNDDDFEADVEDFEEWPLEVFVRELGKYVPYGDYMSGEDIPALPDGEYKVKENKVEGFYNYGPDEYEFEVLGSEVTFYDEEDEVVEEPLFQNVGPFNETETFWAMPGEWIETDDGEEFVADSSFETFGKSWGGFIPFSDGEVDLRNHEGLKVGTVTFATSTETTTATFNIQLDDYQLLEYHIHVTDKFEEKQVKGHKDETYSVRPGQFNDKSDGFAGFEDEFQITIPIPEDDVEEPEGFYVAVHGVIGIPVGEMPETLPSEVVEEVVVPEGVIVVEDWKDKEEIAPSDRGNKLGVIKKENPDFYDFFKELDKKGGSWKKFKVE